MQNQSNPYATALAAAVRAVSDYDFDRPRTRLVELERLINSTHGNLAARIEIENAMAQLLRSSATVAAKQFVCKKLWMMGTDLSVPALATLLEAPNPVLAEAACYALRSQESAAATAALRRALDRVRGVARASIINVLGDKHDTESSSQLSALAADPDPLVSDAAIAALGKIASNETVAALTKIHRASSELARRLQSAHALLQAGQQLAKRGDSAAAKAIWRLLNNDSEPSQIRRGASLALKG
jgi:HEAT repeat protein